MHGIYCINFAFPQVLVRKTQDRGSHAQMDVGGRHRIFEKFPVLTFDILEGCIVEK